MVWFVTLLWAALLVLWSVLMPVWRAPDEPQHVDMVLAVREDPSWPAPNGRRVSARVLASMAEAHLTADPRRPFLPSLEQYVEKEAPPRDARLPLAVLAPDVSTRFRNQMPQHPPLYYWTLAGVAELTPGIDVWPHDRFVGYLRVVSALFVAPLPLLGHAAARRLAGPGPLAVGAAAAPLAVPQLAHIGSVVNNDSLLILAGGLLTVALVHVARGDRSRRTAAAVGVVSCVALLTKGLALFLPVWVGCAYLLAGLRHGWRSVWRPFLLVSALLGLGGLWWLRNLVVYGRVQPSYIQPRGAPSGFTPRVQAVLDYAGDVTVQTYWGAFGWYEVHLSDVVVVTATVVTLALVAAALVFGVPSGVRRGDGGRRAELGLLLIPTLATAGIVGYGAWIWYRGTGHVAGMQGRYLYAGATGLLTVAVAGVAVPLRRRLAGFVPLAVLAAAGLLQLLAIADVLRRYWGAEGSGPREALEALIAWAPWPAGALGVAAVLGLAAAAEACMLMLVHAVWALFGSVHAEGVRTAPRRREQERIGA